MGASCKHTVLPVTVVIPAYNCEKTLDAALSSLLDAPGRPETIWVVDDGSTDQTAEVCRACMPRAATQGVRLRLCCRPHKGVAAARNEGIRRTESAWLAFCDADDTVEPEWLAALYACRSEIRLPICGYYTAARTYLPPFAGDAGWESFAALYGAWVLNSCCNKLYSVPKIREKQIICDERLAIGEDIDFNLKYSEGLCGFTLCTQALYRYRPSAHRISAVQRLARQLSVWRRLHRWACGQPPLTREDCRALDKICKNAAYYALWR